MFGSDSTDAFLFAPCLWSRCTIWTLVKAAPEEKPRIKALLAVYAVVIVFWAVFKQNGTALTTWAKVCTDRTMPALLEAPAKALGSTQTVKMEKDSFPMYDAQFRTTKNPATGKAMKAFSYPPYFNNVPPEQRPAEGQSIKLVSTEIFQSVNPFFVIVFTPLLIWVFSWLRARKREPMARENWLGIGHQRAFNAGYKFGPSIPATTAR